MNKQILSLLVLLISVCAAAYFLYIKSMEQAPEKTLLYPRLLENADKIDRVKVSRADGVVIDARRTRDGWRTKLQQPAINYPIDQQSLTDLAESLTKAVLFESKTAKSENFSRLGLLDVEQTDSQAALIQIEAAGDSYQVLVGIVANSGQGSYIRKVGENQTWLLDRVINLPTDKVDWLKQPILDVDPQSIIAVKRTDSKSFSIIKQQNDEMTFALSDIPEGQTLKYDSILDGFVNNITSLNFDGIENLENDLWQANDIDASFEISMDDGLTILLSVTEIEEQYFAKFESFNPDVAHYWNGQTYKISSFAFGQLNKGLDDFVEIPAVESDTPEIPSIDEGEAPSGD
ncbi:MAG: hypothetical protein Alis3KO_33230 [Aliiglaciecola sp.]